MINDIAKINNFKSNMEPVVKRQLCLANFNQQDELSFHLYLKNISQRLLGDTINLDNENIIFVLSDKSEQNAAFVHNFENDHDLIFITESLLNLCENEDQLAFILAHELGHYEEYRRLGQHTNNKAEETSSDLKAIQKMARGGYNLEEAHKIAAKLFTSNAMNIESLKDEHSNDNTRLNAIDAMIIATKQRVIEDNETQVTNITQVPLPIKKIVSERPKQLSFAAKLYSRINETPSAEEASKIWLEAFHEAISDYDNNLIIAPDDIKTLGNAISVVCSKSPNKADDFFAAVLIDLEKHKNDERFDQMKTLMNDVLNKSKTYQYGDYHTYVDADNKESKVRKILTHYLKGFREASGDEFDKTVKKFEYIKSLVVPYFNINDSYNSIWVKNFNLLELEFNESDIGKYFSPEVIKYIKHHVNSQDQFETLSGLKINFVGDNLVIKNEKLSNGLIVNRNGKVEASLPLETLDEVYTYFIAKTIRDAHQDVNSIMEGKNISEKQKFDILKNAYSIIKPQTTLNNLKNIIQIRSRNKQQILMQDVVNILPDDTKQFIAERNSRPYEFTQSPYTNFIVDNMAEYIKTAPKEQFNDILEYFTHSENPLYLSGEEKLLSAFMDNKEFTSIMQSQFDNMSLTPTHKDEWFIMNVDDETSKLSLLFSKLHTITELKLLEHISNGQDLNSFEAPFSQKIGEICGFNTGKYTKEELENSLYKTRNENVYNPSLLEEAYMLYYSYDALKDNADIDLNLTFGTNCAGKNIERIRNVIENCLHEENHYKIDQTEREHLIGHLETVNNVHNYVYQKLNKQIHDEKNWSNLNGHTIFYSTLYNTERHPQFNSIVKNKEFLDICLKLYEYEKDKKNCILSLSNILEENISTVEQDAIKGQIFPIISSVFAQDDISIDEKTKTFCNLSHYQIFKSDNIDYYNVLIGPDGKSGLLKDISNFYDNETKEYCYTMLLNQENRIPDPEIRATIIKNLASVWHQRHQSYNDITATQEERNALIEDIPEIKNSDIATTDKVELLKELSELMMSQRELSLALKPKEINLDAANNETIAGAYGVDAIAYVLHNYPASREQMQEFLLGYGLPEEAAKFEHEIKYALCKEADELYHKNLCEKFEKGEDIGKELPYYIRDPYYKINVANLVSFKKEFDAATLEAKAIVLNELLTTGKDSWQSSFNVVSEKLFEGAGTLAQMGTDFLYSYIDARPDSEKTFYLAAMMAAANNKSKSAASNFVDSPFTPEQRNLAKGLRLFLENSGPAGTKLAQAMASYSDVPSFIRFEMQFAKSQANPPARWEIFSGNDDTTDTLQKHGALGKRLGSASFFVTYELGDKIVKILRRGAKIKADNEFGIYKEMLTTLQKRYNNISSFSRLIDNAAGNVNIETDLDIGYKQLLDAKKLYPDTVRSDNIEFKLNVMDWAEKGKDWAILEKAQGVDFKDLDGSYKTAVAKAIFSTELANMLSGKRFDSDRHGGQYKIDPKTNTIGIFDTGSISMVEPSAKEQEVLGIVLARTIKGLRNDDNIANVFSKEIDKATNEFYKTEISQKKPVPPYLSEFQRGMLALNDFYGELKPKDLVECITKSLNNRHHKIHENIVKGFKKELIKDIKNKDIVSDITTVEHIDKLSPEAKADRRIGMILFDAIYTQAQKGGSFNLSDKMKEKLLPKLKSYQSSLQIFKGVVRSAWAKINPENYSVEDRQQLGQFLYQICAQDTLNKKLKKDISIQEVFNQVEKQNPHQCELCKNISTLLKTIAPLTSTDSEQIKRAALFVAFTDKEVAKGYKSSLREDKNIGLGQKLIRHIEPLSFIPPKAKKLLIKNYGKKIIVNYLNQQICGNNAKVSKQELNYE